MAASATAADEEAMEITLLNKRDAKVYKVPPAASASGHKAGDWQEAIWKGSVRINAKGKDLTIKLLNNGSGDLFAQCFIPNGDHEKYCEPVIDSSRYWVLKVVNGSRHAFIGFGFSDRNDAFDFKVCLQDFKSTFVDRDKEVEASVTAPMKDLSLKEGEKISVSIAGVTGTRRRSQESSGAATSGPFGLLPPPPPAGGGLGGLAAPPAPSASVAAAAPAAAAPPPVEDFADFGDFADFQSAAAQQSL